jgi:hypothetical protein
MKSIRDILGLMEKKSFRLELLLVSTLVIISASAFVYAGMPYHRALNVGNSAGSEVSFTPATIMILLVSVIVAGFSLFSFRREASKHVSNAPRAGGSFPTEIKPSREEEWEESPRKEESEE